MAEKPQTPSQGKPMDAEQSAAEAQDATKATSEQKAAEKAADKPAAKPKKPAAKKAEGTAAKKTGADKQAAEALAGTGDEEAEGKQAKPKRAKAKTETDDKADKPKAAKKAPPKKGDAEPAPAAEEKADTPKPAAAPRRRDRRQAGQRVVVRAQAKYVRSSARKARLVCEQIRGKSVPEARALLAFSPREVSEAWTKLLESAVANAENNHDLVGEDLRVLAVFADEGPTIKRFRPRAMGRATPIHKRTSHLTIQLTPKETR